MKRFAVILLSLALCLTLPAWAADVSPVLRLEDGALTLEGLGDRSINSVQLELTLRGSGAASFSPPDGDVYGVGKTDGNKLTIYVDSPLPLNQGGTVYLGTLALDGGEITRAELTLLDRGLNASDPTSIQVRQPSGGSPSTPSGGGSGPTGSGTTTPGGSGSANTGTTNNNSGSDSGSDDGSGPSSTGTAKPKPDASSPLSFADVPADAYYYDAVAWAVANGVTTGVSANAFSPDASCTRAQIVTFLWRAAGSPAMGGANPFEDVATGEYYYDAVQWAVANGVTTGTSAGTFDPDAPCTRAQAVAFLYRARSSPAVHGTNGFADLAPGAYYLDAVQWAVDAGVTTGATPTAFSPDAPCTRAQIVTFLYRDRA